MANTGGEWVSSECLDQTSEVLGAIDALGARCQEITHLGAAEGSLAMSDRALPLGQLALELASVSWSIGADHVIAWHRLLTRGLAQPMAAHITLARSAIEGAVMCRWLLDPGLDAEERRWRGAAAQLEDHRQRHLFEVAAGIDKMQREPPAMSGAQRRAELEARMRQASVRSRGREPRVPDMTTLYRDYALPDAPGRGEWLYRGLSGFAHGKQWSALLGDIGRVREIAGIPGAQIARFTSNDQLTLLAARSSIGALERALAELASYAGRG